MKFAGVVILFNPDKKVKKNIETYIENIDKLYVVDNTINKDNTSMFNFNKKIEYISEKKNLGVSKALNIAALKAYNEGYDWLLTMDQDSYFEVNSLKKMINFVECLKSDKTISTILEKKYNEIGLIAPFYKLNDNYNSSGDISFPLMVMTSGNLINLKIYKKIGGYKDWMFIDCVDFDYCLNLKQNNYEILQLNTAILNHSLGNTKQYKFLFRKVTSSNHSALRKYYIVRNRHYLYDLYHEKFPEYCNLEIKCTKKEIIKILLLEKNKYKKIKFMLKGYLDYKKNIIGEYGKNEKKKNI